MNTLNTFISFRTHASYVIEVDSGGRGLSKALARLLAQTEAKTDHQMAVHQSLSPGSPSEE